MSCFGGGACEDREDLAVQTRKSKVIDAQLAREKEAFKATRWLLVLGARESGKSMLVKQMEVLNKGGLSDEEKYERVLDIKSVVKDVIIRVAQEMPRLGIELANPDNIPRLRYIQDLVGKHDFDYPPEFFAIVEALWNDSGVQACFLRSDEQQPIEYAPYFMETLKLREIAKEYYKPSDQDILQCEILTSGVIETRFTVERKHLHVLDVGGQRIESRKYLQCFSDVTAIIFVVDCGSFNLDISEDGKTNRLHESLYLFERVWSSRWLRRVAFILFLNKQDILREKVDHGENIEDYFPEFSSYRPPQEALDKREPGDSDKFIRAKYFIRDQFLRISQKSHDGRHYCYPYFTTAVDTENIRRVFDSCHDIVHRMFLQKHELL